MNTKPHMLGVLIVAGMALSHTAVVADEGEPERPQAPSERAEIRLFLLDVEVTDKHGRPLPGLTEGDFRVTIDGRQRDIYSVDDLCSCSDTLPEATALSSCVESAELPGPQPASRYDGEAVRHVLYFDMSQLAVDGRIRALAEARRWLREVKQPGEEVLLAAYSTQAGLRELTPFTADRSTLEATLDEIEHDPRWLDPFPSFFTERVKSCPECIKNCYPRTAQECCADQCINNPREEYRHGRWSFEALQRLLGSLEHQSGRKVLLAFYQNWLTYPARYYPILSDFEVGDHLGLLETIGVDANHARTAVWPAFAGDRLVPGAHHQSVNVGANLADFSGGRYNRTFARLPELTTAAGRGCACTYRIGLLSPPRAASKEIFRVKVEAAGRQVPHRYRVQFLDERDRWWRQARMVLAHPEAYDDLRVSGALLPVSRTKAGWNLSALLGVDLGSLMLFPEADGRRGEWEVGALLHRERGRGKWEMLGTSAIRVGPDDLVGTPVVHERMFEDLAAGTYRLAGFVRDRVGDLVGATEATVTLPAPGRAGVAGPVVVRWGPQVHTTLPLVRKAERAASSRAAVRVGASPERGRLFGENEQVQMLSWICPDKADVLPPQSMRFVSTGDDALFRFDSVAEPAGSCFKLTDTIATWALDPGVYRYHLRWTTADLDEPAERTVEFRVAGPATAALR